MTTYKTNIKAPYWTQSGSSAGTIPLNTTIELTGNSRTIKDGTLMVYEIGTAPYTGKYIEMKYLTAVATPPPDPSPTIYVTHTILVYSDGSIDLDGIHYPPIAS